MSIYYKIYIAPDPLGPWQLVNNEPLPDNGSAGNEYTIENLINDNLYYVMVVGGTFVGNTFTPLCGQPIGPNQDSGASIANPNIIAARVKAVAYLG